MPRPRTTTLSRRRFEGFTRDQLYSEIHSLLAEPYLVDSWGPIFSGLSAAPVLDDLSDLQHLLDHVTNDSLVDCALALGTALESAHESATIHSTRKARRKQRPSPAIRVTTSEDWLRARERRIQKTLQSPRRNGAPRETTDHALRHKLQDAQDLADKNRCEIEELRVRLRNSEQEREKCEQQLSSSKAELRQLAPAQERTNGDLIDLRQQMKAQEVALGRLHTDLDRVVETEAFNQNALHETRIEMRQMETALATVSEKLQSCEAQRDELEAQRDGLGAALYIAKDEGKSAQHRLGGALDTVSQRKDVINDLKTPLQDRSAFLDTPHTLYEDPTACGIGDDLIGSGKQPWSGQSVMEGLACLTSSPMSEVDRYFQGDEVSQHESWTTDPSETDSDQISPSAWVPPRCCDQMPVAITNARCELCPEHCEKFTWLLTAEMGTTSQMGVITCPACNGPLCESAELSSWYSMN